MNWAKGKTLASFFVVLAVGGTFSLTGCSPQQDRSASGDEESWVVSVGDSFISGEAGRWAGNQTWATDKVDALSSTAYNDSPSGETIVRCHRSQGAVIHIGEVQSINLACSGAETQSKINSAGSFKPGIDFYDQGGLKGQALMLQEFAELHSVKLVALSIGGNDFGFSDIISSCIKSFLQPSVFGSYCKDDPAVQKSLGNEAAEVVKANTRQAILNIATAMENAGYTEDDWTLGLQLYPNVLANTKEMRYSEFGYDRQLVGGCGVRNRDLDWAATNMIPVINSTFAAAAAEAQNELSGLRVVTLNSTDAFGKHTLCNKDVHRVGTNGGAQKWSDANAVDLSEWVMEINMANPNDTYLQESLHPNYWGQLALRSCWRQVWNNGDIRGGTCVKSEAGLNERGEPNMVLN
jgi:hypothetical protein